MELVHEPQTSVRVLREVLTREPGTDQENILVRAGETGVVLSSVPEWHDVEVALHSRDGQTVWIDEDNLEVAPREGA
jgi:hypothetical protein